MQFIFLQTLAFFGPSNSIPGLDAIEMCSGRPGRYAKWLERHPGTEGPQDRFLVRGHTRLPIPSQVRACA